MRCPINEDVSLSMSIDPDAIRIPALDDQRVVSWIVVSHIAAVFDFRHGGSVGFNDLPAIGRRELLKGAVFALALP